MTNNKKILLIVIVLAAFCFAGWLFTDIFVYMFIAIFLAILGSPLVDLLMKIKIRKFRMPRSAAAAITLLVIISAFSCIFYFLIPLVFNEIKHLKDINTVQITSGLQLKLAEWEFWLQNKGLITSDVHLSDSLAQQVNNLIDSFDITSFVGNIGSLIGLLVISVFSVLFMTFFALKDTHVFWKLIKKMIPTELRDNFDHILVETKHQLIRYFGGVLIEMIAVGTLEGLLCWALGVPNALLIGVIGGALNIIPYVGPLIAGICGVLIGVSPVLAAGGASASITALLIKIIAAFVIVKLVDDFILQPIISGKSVNAHPLEIFVVILVAGKVGGIFGMIFAVPAYTLLRIIIREFFSQYYHEEEITGSE